MTAGKLPLPGTAAMPPFGVLSFGLGAKKLKTQDTEPNTGAPENHGELSVIPGFMASCLTMAWDIRTPPPPFTLEALNDGTLTTKVKV
jgi:hypothetical protein